MTTSEEKKPALQVQPGAFRSIISEDSNNQFQPESGRYHLYVSYPCPFAHRALLARKLKGLEDHIGLSITHSTFQKTKPEVDDHLGWVFRNPEDEPLQNSNGFGSYSCKNCLPDTVNNAKTIRELYELADGIEKKYSVPILWDKKTKTIVSNESADIVRMFNNAFNKLAKNPELDLYPEALRSQIDELNEWIFDKVNIGVYKAGFVQTQEAYERGLNGVFEGLDKLEEILGKSRYLTGEEFTEADLKLFPTLLRFDDIYYIMFKCNKKRLVDYPNLLNYTRDIYQIEGVAETLNLEEAKIGYYSNKPELNHYGIVPVGPDTITTLSQKHDRDRF